MISIDKSDLVRAPQEAPTKLDAILAANALCSFFGRFNLATKDVTVQAVVDLLGAVKAFGEPPSSCDYHANTDNGWDLERKGAHLFHFGAYGCTHVLSFGSLEDALEDAAETLKEVAPGLFVEPEYADAKNEIMGETGCGDDMIDEDSVRDRAEQDLTYTESGWLCAYEWTVAGPFHSYDALVSYVRGQHGEDLDRR